MVTFQDIVFLHKGKSAAIAILLVFLLVFVIMIPTQESARTKLHQELVTRGMQAEATIVDKYKDVLSERRGSQKKTSTRYHLVYNFQIGNSVINSTKQADSNIWELKQIGDTFTVLYLPENPQSNLPEWKPIKSNVEVGAYVMTGIVFLIVCAALYFVYRTLSKIKCIMNNGVSDKAIVTREIVHSGKKRRSYSYEYAFETRDGQKQVGITDKLRQPEHQTGDAIDILYLKNDPEKNMHLTPVYRDLWLRKKRMTDTRLK